MCVPCPGPTRRPAWLPSSVVSNPAARYEVHRNAKTKLLEVRPALRKCLHYYFYLEHPIVRPDTRAVADLAAAADQGLHQRSGLAGATTRCRGDRLSEEGQHIHLHRGFPAAQALLDDQLQVNWPIVLDELVRQFHPMHAEVLVGAYPLELLLDGGAERMGHRRGVPLACGVGRVVSAAGASRDHDLLQPGRAPVPAAEGPGARRGARSFAGEVVSDLKQRPEGMRIKHAAALNSVKLYDKQGQVLRVETTIHDATGLKVYRPVASDPEGAKQWQPLRKGVADLHRRCELSQAANERYLEALAAVESPTPLEELSGPLCRRVVQGRRRYRGLNPLSDKTRAIGGRARGRALITGFRNRDLRQILYGDAPVDKKAHRRQSNRVGRLLALFALMVSSKDHQDASLPGHGIWPDENRRNLCGQKGNGRKTDIGRLKILHRKQDSWG